MFGEILRRPAVGPRHDADRAGLVVQIDLVAAHAENLARNLGCGIRPEERNKLGDVIRSDGIVGPKEGGFGPPFYF